MTNDKDVLQMTIKRWINSTAALVLAILIAAMTNTPMAILLSPVIEALDKARREQLFELGIVDAIAGGISSFVHKLTGYKG